MTKSTPMTEDALKALTDSELRQSVGYYGGKLAEQRRKAEVYYLGLAKDDLSPPDVEGRSKVVSTDVRNTIEAMLPQLMLKFTGGDSVVDFEATKPGDEEKAKQCTDYLNYLFFKKNNGHQTCYTWFKDALLQKRGIVKVWWDDRTEETREEYRGLSQVELTQIADDKELEITEQTSRPDEEDADQRQKALEQLQSQLQQAMQAAQHDPQAGQAVQQLQAHMAQIQQQLQAHMAQIQQTPPAMLFDIVCKRTKSAGKVAIENVPPEEFLISRKAKMDIQSAPFVGHRVARTASELISMGYPRSKIEELSNDDGAAINAERVERMSWDDEQAYLNVDSSTADPSQRQIWVTECYMRVDFDGDGIAELRKIVRAGNEILDNEIVDVIPFCSICPVPLPHKFFGLSIADLGMEGQKTNTAILRATLDNLYLEVNGRYFAVEGQVNLDDLLTSRPGGVVRIKSQGAVGRLDQGKGNLTESMEMLEYMKGFVEDSTGWSRQSQGNDPSALNGETATKSNIVTNKADMRTDLIARNFAEGVVDLFRMMLKLVSQHQDKKAEIQISGNWVAMDPREWRNQFDVSINVGLGVGSKDQQIQHLMALQNAQGHGLAIGIATPENMYNSAIELAKNMGFKSGDKFFTKPDPNSPPPNPAAQEMQAKMQMQGQELQAKGQMQQVDLQHKAQLAQMQTQFDMQAKEADRAHEAQLEQTRAQLQAQVDMNRDKSQAEQETLKMQQAAQLAQLESQYKEQAHLREQDMAWQKAQLDSATKIEVANIMSKAKIEDAATQAATAQVARSE